MKLDHDWDWNDAADQLICVICGLHATPEEQAAYEEREAERQRARFTSYTQV